MSDNSHHYETIHDGSDSEAGRALAHPSTTGAASTSKGYQLRESMCLSNTLFIIIGKALDNFQE
jgi:hypothetical protein